MGHIVRKAASDGTLRYYARYKLPSGRWRWEGGYKRKRDAEALLARREKEIAEGAYGMRGDIAFSDFADEWLRNYAALKVKPKTLRDYEAITRNHLKPYFGKELLRTIDAGKIQGMVARKKESGLSASTVTKILVVLKEMLKHAQVWGYIRENPASFVTAPRRKREEMDYLTPEEVRRFLDASPPDCYALFATAVFTGMRQGELLGLKWGDIDLERRLIYVRRSYTEGRYSETKTPGSMRTVVISPFLVDVLKGHKATTRFRAPEDPVFASSSGKPLDAVNLVKRDFLPTLERAGLRRIRFHDLRHTYAALMISLGENLLFVQRQMGHASISTTTDLYGHLLPQASKGVGERFDRAVFGEDVVPISEARERVKAGR